VEEELHQDHAEGADGVALTLPCSFDLEKLGEGSTWVLDRIIFFCKKMGLSIKGKEMELLSFLASLEANRMKGDLVGDSLVPDGANH